MSLLKYNIRKIQKGGAKCDTGLDFITHVECQTRVQDTNGKLRIEGGKYTAYEIGGDLFSSLPFEKYECKITKENQLVNTGILDTQKKFTRFMAVVKKGSLLPQVKFIISNHNEFKREDGKKEDDEEIELFTLVIHDGSIIPSLTFKNIQEGKEPKFIKELRDNGVEILKDESKNQTWMIYTKKYTEREQAQRDGGKGLHPGYDLISFFNTFKYKLPPLKQSDEFIPFLTDEQKKALGLVNPKPEPKPEQNNDGEDVKNPLKWNDNTNIEIKHTINGEVITKYKDIMNDGKKFAQMSVGRTNQYKNNTDLKSACTIFALKAIEYLLEKNLNELTYDQIWINGIEKDVAEKYRDLKEGGGDVEHTSIFEAKKAFNNLESKNLEFPTKYFIVRDENDDNILNFGKQNFDIIKTFLSINGDYGLVLTSNLESISITKKRDKYYFYESHPTGGKFNDKEIFINLEYPNSVIIQFETIEFLVSFIKERFPETSIPGFDQVAICKIKLKK